MTSIYRFAGVLFLVLLIASVSFALVAHTASDSYPDKPAPDGYHWCLKTRLVMGENGRPVMENYWALCPGSLSNFRTK